MQESTMNQNMQAKPDNQLVWAILSTVLCCLPLGIISIIKATKVNELWAQGDYEGAKKAASDAKKFAIWSAVAWALIIVPIMIIYFVVIVAATAGGNAY
jgi:uncharacterized membrane protein YjgN (DUF898 family)